MLSYDLDPSMWTGREGAYSSVSNTEATTIGAGTHVCVTYIIKALRAWIRRGREDRLMVQILMV